MTKTSLRGLQRTVLVVAVALFFYLLYRIGPDVIVSDLQAIGWGVGIVLVLELLVDAAGTLGWWLTFAPAERRMGLPFLFCVRLAGTAVNQVTPAASLGGEPLKIALLRPRVSVAAAVASVLTAKLSQTAAQALFIVLGALIALDRLRIVGAAWIFLLPGFALTLGGLTAFFLLQRRGPFAAAAELASRLRLPERWVERLRRAAPLPDQHIRDFYRLRPADFGLSVLAHFSGFGFGILQVYLLLRWLGLPADAITCVAIEAFSLLLQFVLFVVPGGIGVQEGGKMVIFAALGLPSAAGLSVGIAFRLTQIAETAIGLGLFAALQQLPLPILAGDATATAPESADRDSPKHVLLD